MAKKQTSGDSSCGQLKGAPVSGGSPKSKQLPKSKQFGRLVSDVTGASWKSVAYSKLNRRMTVNTPKSMVAIPKTFFGKIVEGVDPEEMDFSDIVDDFTEFDP